MIEAESAMGAETAEGATSRNGNGNGKEPPKKPPIAEAREPDYQEYRIKKAGNNGELITQIWGRGPHHIIYETESRLVRVEYHDSYESELAPLLAEFSRLKVLAECRLTGKKKAAAIKYLGLSLQTAIVAKAKAADAHFSNTSAFINTKADQNARLVFLCSVAISVFVLLAALLALRSIAPSTTNLATAAIAGAFGAFLASLVRSSEIQIDPFSTMTFVVAQGVNRILLGTGFAVIAAMFIQAKLALGMVAEPSAVMAVCVLAGFSQRFVPELLGRMESQLGKDDADKTQPKSPAP
ncbi:MAG TPA: hypothetical protein VEL28_10330 [Candidatus Binatia bacterium]|nr:hypothetical protein [Candidatus Binatia bacterium]